MDFDLHRQDRRFAVDFLKAEMGLFAQGEFSGQVRCRVLDPECEGAFDGATSFKAGFEIQDAFRRATVDGC
jgi:hypothetical protein